MAIEIGKGCYIAKTAVLIGNVKIEDNVSVFDNAVLRGDMNYIKIGEGTNIQDNVTIHTEMRHPTIIGKRVSVGHNAIVHGAVLEDEILVGMGSIVMNGARIPSGCVIAAGTVITENFTCDENSLVAGVPGKVKRSGDENLRRYAIANAASYDSLMKDHLSGKFERTTGSDLLEQ